MAINPADFGLEWQNSQIAALPQQAQLQFSGQGGMTAYDPKNFDAYMANYLNFLGPSIGSVHPSAQWAPGSQKALELFFPNTKNFDMNAINRTVTDVKSPFSPYYFGVSAEGYEAPVGKAGPGGVIFNSGLGKTNENPGDYKTPGAGLWAAGFDLNDPLLVQKLYDHFGKNRGEVWNKYQPTQGEDGAWKKASSQEALAFVSDADEFFRKEALKMDLPKRGIMDSLAGQLITGALIGAATGGFGTIVGGFTGSSALGNLATLAASSAIGGAQGGLEGALTSALGSAVGAGIDQAGGLGNIGDFLSDPLGNIGAAYGIGGGAFSGLNFSGMEEAAQVGPGSLAQNTSGGLNPNSLGANQEFYANPSFGGADNYMGEVVISAPAGDVAQLAGGGFGSAAGGAAGSAVGQLLTGGGAAGAGSLDVGGLLDTGAPAIGSPGSPTGSIQSVIPGAGTSMGSGQPGGSFYGDTGPGSSATGAQTGQQDAYGSGAAGMITGGFDDNFGGFGSDTAIDPSQKKFGIDDALTAGLLGGPWDFSGTPTGTIPTGGPGDGIGTFSTGPGGTGPGGDGLGGDGTGGDGLGGDGLGGDLTGGFQNFGLLSGMSPGSIEEALGVMAGGRVGVKKKAGQSFYSPVKSPKRRKGITLRRA
jgi:hypothetical protein